jgi:hypothetical protein
MRRTLVIHPQSVCTAVQRIDVAAGRPDRGRLALQYSLTGSIGDLRLPPAGAPMRAEGLWRHTCFEAFLRAPASAEYCELNFAPSTQWAAYAFNDYRDGMAPIAAIGAPRIEPRVGGDRYEMKVTVALENAPLPHNGAWRLGLSAVIEEADGRISYWALAHPPGKPDFHHPDCFALELAAPEQT